MPFLKAFNIVAAWQQELILNFYFYLLPMDIESTTRGSRAQHFHHMTTEAVTSILKTGFKLYHNKTGLSQSVLSTRALTLPVSQHYCYEGKQTLPAT